MKNSQKYNIKDLSRFSHIKTKTKIIHGPLTQFKSKLHFKITPTVPALLVPTSRPILLVEASSCSERPGQHSEPRIILPPPHLPSPSITPTVSPLTIISLSTPLEEAIHSIIAQARVLISRAQTSILNPKYQANFLKNQAVASYPSKSQASS